MIARNNNDGLVNNELEKIYQDIRDLNFFGEYGRNESFKMNLNSE